MRVKSLEEIVHELNNLEMNDSEKNLKLSSNENENKIQEELDLK